MSYILGLVAVIVGARYWFVSMDLREENYSLKNVNEMVRSENERYVELLNVRERTIGTLHDRLNKYKRKRGKDGKFTGREK